MKIDGQHELQETIGCLIKEVSNSSYKQVKYCMYSMNEQNIDLEKGQMNIKERLEPEALIFHHRGLSRSEMNI